MQILIDTGATNTFINYKTLQSINQSTNLNKHSSSFVLADGIAPFHVLGVVELEILFSDQITTISAHVAQNLCTDVILGMDYITLYNLKFNIRKQIVSIDLNNRQYQMKNNQNVQTKFIPVTLSDSLYIPRQSNRFAKVSIPISSISSHFIPYYQFSLCNTAFIPHKFLEFRNHFSRVTFSNTSPRPHFVPRGTRIGYLCHYAITQPSTTRFDHCQKSCGVTNELGESPDFHASDNNTLPKINYLGHTISDKVVTPMKEKIQAILDIKEPRLLSQANKFLGALSWYRKFLPNFSTIAAPIHAVTNLTKNNRHKFHWRFAQKQAFKQLKEILISTPLFLHFPIADKPLILTTDASGIGIGGVLQQEVDGHLHNLYYHSQVLTPCRQITIMTDHCPLCHIMTKTINNARVDRISTLIQEYNIDKVVHIHGRQNCLPDYLSRYPREQNDELFDIEYGLDSKTDSAPIISSTNNIVASMILRPRNNRGKCSKSSSYNDDRNIHNNNLPCHSNTPDQLMKTHITSTFSTNNFDITKLKDEQQKDPLIQKYITQVRSNPQNISFKIKNDILYKVIIPFRLSKTKIEVIYLPNSMISSLLHASHNDPMSGGHFSVDRTYSKLRKHYWWPNMKYSIKQYIKSCLLCQQYNIGRQKKPGRLRSISPPEGPFQVIGMDFCGPLKRTPRENRYVLIITDYFTRHVVAIPLPNCSAEKTAEALFNEYFCKFGVPSLIITDQGSHFRNQLLSNMRLLIGYNHIYSTPYHPQTNGIVERFNSTFIPQISKLQDSENNNWDEYLQAVVFAYNSGTHKTTKYSPYELLYGRSPRLPFHPKPFHFSFQQPNDYFEQLKKTLKLYHQATRFNIIQQQARNKVYYDRNRTDPIYNIGDRVLTRVHGIKGKLDPIFSPTPKVIIHTSHPIYIVRDEQKNIESRVHVCDLRHIIVD
ncbi:unnamed protein product [Rotaria sp. Silwood1]|nr:unnamed protein product [Rotaria sp. Silwood1]